MNVPFDEVWLSLTAPSCSAALGRAAPTGRDLEKSTIGRRMPGCRMGICVGESSAISEFDED